MSEMTIDPGHSDALAAEYVLGTLEFDERSQAQTLLGTDENFAAKVRVWERRLGELHVMVEPVEPDGRIWERIKVKIPQTQPSPEVKPTEPEPQGPPQPPPENQRRSHRRPRRQHPRRRQCPRRQRSCCRRSRARCRARIRSPRERRRNRGGHARADAGHAFRRRPGRLGNGAQSGPNAAGRVCAGIDSPP